MQQAKADKPGLKLNSREKGYADFKTESIDIDLGKKNIVEKTTGQEMQVGGKQHLVLAWDAVENVDRLYSDLKEKGVEFVAEPKTQPWGQKVAYFSDPYGNIWEISTWMKKENE